MPTYDYYCKACDKALEVFQSISAERLTVCPECDKRGKITRKISGGSGIIFKGSGFYETDYKSKGGKPDADKAPASDSQASKTAEAPSKPAQEQKSTSK